MFGHIAEQEAKIRDDLDRRIDDYQSSLAAVGALVGLEHHAGFKHFLKAVEETSQKCEDKLRSYTGTDAEMRILQGRAQAFKEVLAVCHGGIPLQKRLADLLQAAQDQKRKTILANGNVVPQGST
jgi:hypothetical protein